MFSIGNCSYLYLCAVCAKSLQSSLTLRDPMDCSPSGSFVHWILQARILEWVAISFSRGSFRPRNWTQVSWIANWATREACENWDLSEKITLNSTCAKSCAFPTDSVLEYTHTHIQTLSPKILWNWRETQLLPPFPPPLPARVTLHHESHGLFQNDSPSCMARWSFAAS